MCILNILQALLGVEYPVEYVSILHRLRDQQYTDSGTRLEMHNIVKGKRQIFAYAYGLGRAILICKRRKGMVAYSVISMDFPFVFTHGKRPLYIWEKVLVSEALDAIKHRHWENRDITPDIEYIAAKPPFREWMIVDQGSIYHYIGNPGKAFSNTGEQNIVVRKLKSGKLRVEINGIFWPAHLVGKMINAVQTADTDDFGNIKYNDDWRAMPYIEQDGYRIKYIFSIAGLGTETRNELIAQSVAHKILRANEKKK